MMHPVSSTLISWFQRGHRDLPWRRTKDPYRIWLSEIILQQTRVAQGQPYYERFTAAFPDVKSLAKANEDKVLKLWQGLGYYSRARNLHRAAKVVAEKHHGRFPTEYESILALPGVGTYTAAAIASFAYDLPYPVVDGNVFRVLSRIFGISTPIDSTAGKKEFTALAGQLLEGAPPYLFNQAIMEFGAMVCVPKTPACESCPLVLSCEARKQERVNRWPVKSAKTPPRDRYLTYLVIQDKGSTYFRQRKEKDIWKNLWEFPVLESPKPMRESTLFKQAAKHLGLEEIVLTRPPVSRKHQLSHQSLHATFLEIRATPSESHATDWIRISWKKAQTLAVPRLIERYIEERE